MVYYGTTCITIVTGSMVAIVSVTLLARTSATAQDDPPDVDTPSPAVATPSPSPRFPYYCLRCSCSYVDGDYGLATNCTNRGLYLPFHRNTVELILQKLNLYKVKSYYFRYLRRLEILDLSHNRIIAVHIDAFRDLHILKILYLHDNNFATIAGVLLPGVFSSLTNLTKLTLHNCVNMVIYNINKSYLESVTFADLESLEYLSLDGTNLIQFDDGFKALTHLKTLVLSGDNGQCVINALTNETFIGVENLENLTLSSCRIKVIDREAFSPLRNLRYLDLSRNTELELAQFGEVAHGLKATNVSVLKINSIHDPNRAGTELLKDNTVGFRDLPLTELYMDANGIEYIDYLAFNFMPSTLRYLSLRCNRLMFSIYVNIAVFNNPKLEVIDASDQTFILRTYPKPRMRKKFRIPGFRKKVSAGRNGKGVSKRVGNGKERLKRDVSEETVTLSLKKLMLTGSLSNIKLIDFNKTVNNISYMDLSRNYIPMLRGYEFLGLPEMRVLNLSQNYIEIVLDTNGFRDLVSLEVLDLHDNLLGFVLESDSSLFSNLGKLMHLNLSMNRVNKLGKRAFIGLHALETLDLSENYLRDMGADLSDMSSLRRLNLSNNRIDSLSERTRNSLDKIAKAGEIKLDLRNNVFSCNCDTLSFLRWLLVSPVTFLNFNDYYCMLNNGSIRYVNASGSPLSDLEEGCRSYLAVTVVGATGGSFAVAFLLSYMVYRNRWKLRYLYYMAKVKIDGHIDAHVDAHFDFDVFLSYADPDRGFVIQDMVEHLERTEGIRLCIRDRDFEIGEVVAVNISKAIRTSKKTLLIVSRHFLKNKWCNFEMNMARMEDIHMKRRVLSVVFLEAVPAKALPLELIDILREYPNTDMPHDDNLKPAFWQTCLGFLKD